MTSCRAGTHRVRAKQLTRTVLALNPKIAQASISKLTLTAGWPLASTTERTSVMMLLALTCTRGMLIQNAENAISD
ncbi:MAG: hypothetical protein JRH14_22510 [Deltaproteobacteria bacterium]|nr:hypothetical protein [Deltaproteobacteria bacterium]